MENLALTLLNHLNREAVAVVRSANDSLRTVTEHEDRVICAACLKKWPKPRRATLSFASLAGIGQCLLVS